MQSLRSPFLFLYFILLLLGKIQYFLIGCGTTNFGDSGLYFSFDFDTCVPLSSFLHTSCIICPCRPLYLYFFGYYCTLFMLQLLVCISHALVRIDLYGYGYCVPFGVLLLNDNSIGLIILLLFLVFRLPSCSSFFGGIFNDFS